MGQYDEKHWYGPYGWPRLRGQIVSLAVQLLPAFREALLTPGMDEIAAARSFAASVVTELGSIVENRVSAMLAAMEEARTDDEPIVRFNFGSGMWDYALPLFGDIDPLVTALVKDAAIIRGTTNRNVRAEQALGQTLRQFLEEARREASPGSAHRLKTWEAVKRVSDTIATAPENADTPLALRGSDEHVLAVFEKLKVQYEGNKNIPNRTLAGLWAYFEEFLPECQDKAAAEYANALTTLAMENEEALVRDLTGNFCLEQLRKKEPELFEVLAVDAGLDEANGEKKAAYMTRKGIGRATFNNRYELGAAAIRECFDKTLRYKLLGPQIL